MKLEDLQLDCIGHWSQIKHEIIEKYAKAYSIILSKQGYVKYIYIDAFSGPGIHKTKDEAKIVDGSPKKALNIDPQFTEYHFIDLNEDKINFLKESTENLGNNIYYYCEDCNTVLLNEVFPDITYKNYKRALCLLDPYGIQLDWEVIKMAGESEVIEIFLNFPVADMNRNVLWNNPDGVTDYNLNRMNKFWGDSSWHDCAYKEEMTLFGPEIVKDGNQSVVEGFKKRLIKEAGFKYVPDPLPMKNSKGAIVYYLFFAATKDVAGKIVNDIFDKYRR